MENKLFQERFSGLTFIDHLELSEGIAPTQTKYGTDGSNGKFEHSRNGYSTLIHDGTEPVILVFDYTARPGWFEFEAAFATLKPGGDPSKLDPTITRLLALTASSRQRKLCESSVKLSGRFANL